MLRRRAPTRILRESRDKRTRSARLMLRANRRGAGGWDRVERRRSQFMGCESRRTVARCKSVNPSKRNADSIPAWRPATRDSIQFATKPIIRARLGNVGLKSGQPVDTSQIAETLSSDAAANNARD